LIVVGTCTAVAAALAARARSPADANRSSGCLAIPRATTASKAAPSQGRATLGRGGGDMMCAPIN
jgi:hypothetical protein